MTTPVPTSPSSEKSVYFDAPLASLDMHHFRSKSKKSSSPPPNPPPASAFGEKQQPQTNGGVQGQGVTRQRSVSIPNDPRVVSNKPDDDFGEGLWREVDGKRRSTVDGSSSSALPNPNTRANKDQDVQGDGAVPGYSDEAPTTTTKHHKHARSKSLGHSAARTSGMGSNISDGGSTFINGPGTTGPHVKPDVNEEEIAERTGYAEDALTEKEKRNIEKKEVRDAKELTRVIKTEAKVEKQALDLAVKQLSLLQQVQKQAVKSEDKSHTAHTKFQSVLNKHEVVFFAAKAKYETAQAELKTLGDSLEGSRKRAREATMAIQEKMKEVECLRTTMGVDERERGAKMAELSRRKSLSGPGRSGSLKR